MDYCPSHARPVRIIAEPLALSAGSLDTPAPLGAAILRLHDSKRRPLLTGLPGYRPAIIRLDWPDMAVPALDADDWQWLADRLAALPAKRLHVHCMAGHGRTGTALAILCHMWGAIPEGDCPVTWLRERYCPKAVETSGQLAYVALITGRTVTAAPSAPAYTPPPPGKYVDHYSSADYFERDGRAGSAADDYRREPVRHDFNRPVGWSGNPATANAGTSAPSRQERKYSRYFPANGGTPPGPVPTEPSTLRRNDPAALPKAWTGNPPTEPKRLDTDAPAPSIIIRRGETPPSANLADPE